MQPHESRDPSRSVVLVTFESEFNRFGGLGAVMRTLPKVMLGYEDCAVVAPFFPALTDLAGLAASGGIDVHEKRFAFSLPIGDPPFVAEVHEVRQRVDTVGGEAILKTYLIGSPGFFTAPRGSGPYVNPTDPDRELDPDTNPIDPDRLTEDALLFSAMVPRLLLELIREELLAPAIVLHLQDWETAAVALAVGGGLPGSHVDAASCVLTLHNPYDRALGPADSAVAATLAGRLGLGQGSLLVQAIDACKGPISTVSESFAEDLVTDPLMTDGFAPHLQPSLAAHGVVGINNGPFIEASFPAQALDQAVAGDLSGVVEVKLDRRKQLIDVLDDYRPPEAWGDLRGLDTFEGPIFLMVGRDDPRQKGYDLAAVAIRDLEPGTAKFVFTPMPGDEGLLGLDFLRRLAEEERSGDVKVFPFQMAKGFKALQEGSTFLLMPSLYEPFGAAIEGYASGTPVVARATGGLALQVDGHTAHTAGTGFLYREQVPVEAQRHGWARILECAYWDRRPRGDRIGDRMRDPLYSAMAAETRRAIEEASAFYVADRERGFHDYARMILNGLDRMTGFSWTKAANHYRLLYTASRRRRSGAPGSESS